MTNLQKQIEELEKLSEQEPDFDPSGSNYDDFLAQGSINGEIFASKKALSIIKQLQEELKKQVSDYEVLAKDFADLEEENYQLKQNVKNAKLIPEVKEAMEEVRDDIKAWVDDVFGEFTPLSKIKPIEPKPVYETLMMISNLLNALDKQFKPDENGSFKHLDNAEEISQGVMKESW